MKSNVYFLPLTLVTMLILTACSSATKQPSVASQQKVQTTPLTSSNNTTTKKENAGNTAAVEASSVIVEATVATKPVDIWQRIRQGYSLPSMNSPLVAKYENWNRKHSDYVKIMLQRGDKYLFHIVEEIEKRNMPMEIALLPAIESAYKAKARSRSNASGLWQFIPSTGRYLGMRQNWWSDQRRDILISTHAALNYLQSLHAEFNGDWLLALAAYNGGKGTIARAIRYNKRKNKPTNLESLKLRRETTHYVPKLIALSHVIMNPDSYGVELPEIGNTPYFTVQKIPGQTDLIRLVKNTDLSRKDLDELNPAFLRWASDPKGPHRILIPIHHKTSVANYLETTPDLGKLNWQEHLIRKGETISQIARKYATNASAIRSINGMKNNNIRAGKTILIPLEAKHSTKGHRYANNPNKAQGKASHQVKRGDTLWDIARRYNLSVADLVIWNNISKTQTLALNQVIKLSNY